MHYAPCRDVSVNAQCTEAGVPRKLSSTRDPESREPLHATDWPTRHPDNTPGIRMPVTHHNKLQNENESDHCPTACALERCTMPLSRCQCERTVHRGRRPEKVFQYKGSRVTRVEPIHATDWPTRYSDNTPGIEMQSVTQHNELQNENEFFAAGSEARRKLC